MEEFTSKNGAHDAILKTYVQQDYNNLNKNKDFAQLESKIKALLKNLDSKNLATDSQFFFDTYNNLKNGDKVVPVVYRKFLLELFQLLVKIDEEKTKNVIGLIKTCEDQLSSLENSTNVVYVKKWFGSFCKSLTTFIINLFKYSKELNSKVVQDIIILHIIQLSTYLQLLLKLFTKEFKEDLLIIESRRFVIKRFKYNFTEIIEILKNNVDEEEKNTNFIFWIDSALELIGNIEPNKTLEKDVCNAKGSIEEVLCHGMSVAQICQEEDSKAIKASVQTVLREYNQLEAESKKLKPNISLINLYVDLVSDKLCILERRVNTAVLKISLKVFSECFEPLNNLQNACDIEDKSILSRNESDLDNFIAEFDLHVDRIMQIGLFAIACSTDKKILSKMKSSLSNLEALESELVPALTNLYMEPSQIAALHANLFIDHWKDEVKKLKDAIFYIIDPIAFGQVVREEYKLSQDILEDVMVSNEIITKAHLDMPIKYVNLFISVVKVSLPDLKLKDDTEILNNLKNLQDVHHELCSASKKFSEAPDPKNNERIFKRLQILLTMIERVLKTLMSVTEQDVNDTRSDKKEDSIKSDLDINVTNIIERGQKLLKDRSMLFRTPKTNKIIKNIVPVPLTPKNMGMTPRAAKYSESRKKAKLFAKKISIEPENLNFDNTLDLQITNILEELTCLMDTLP